MTSPVLLREGLLERRLWQGEEFVQGVRDMLSVTPGVCAWGLVTGVAMAKSGLSLATVLSMSLLVFAASAQLAAMPLILVGAPLWLVWIAATCVNLRFVVFSAQMRRHMVCLPKGWRWIAGYLTADMTFALMQRRYAEGRSADAQYVAPLAYFVGLSVVNWTTWNLASLVGISFAKVIPAHWGLELAGTLALIGLLATLANDWKKITVAIVATAVAIATLQWPYKLGIVVSVVSAIALGALLDGVQRSGGHE